MAPFELTEEQEERVEELVGMVEREDWESVGYLWAEAEAPFESSLAHGVCLTQAAYEEDLSIFDGHQRKFVEGLRVNPLVLDLGAVGESPLVDKALSAKPREVFTEMFRLQAKAKELKQ